MNPSLMIPIVARFQFVKPIVFMGCVQVPIFARVKLDGTELHVTFVFQCLDVSMECAVRSMSTDSRLKLPRPANVNAFLLLMSSLTRHTSIQGQNVTSPYVYLHARTVASVSWLEILTLPLQPSVTVTLELALVLLDLLTMTVMMPNNVANV